MIRLTGVRKSYSVAGRTVTALDGIDLEVPDGAIHGIVGPSGAGKSTLVRCLTGLERPTGGTVRIGDRVISELAGAELRAARRRIGMVFQHVNLMDSRTAAENVALPLEIAGVPRARRRERVRGLLATVGLGERGDNYPAQLSGGERQRVGIARALATEPDVLLFDEPTSALDAASTRQVLHLIRDLRDRLGITMVVITHEMGVVREVCDSVTLLAGGRVVETSRLDAVAAEPGSVLARELIPLPTVAAGEAGSLVEIGFGGEQLSPAGVLRELAAHGLDAEVVAGTIETLGGRPVGRLRLALPASDLDAAARVRKALDAAGLPAEVQSTEVAS